MKKIRINELARELEVKAHEILDRLPELGVTEKKTHSSSIDEDVAIKLRRLLRTANVPERKARRRPPGPRQEPAARAEWKRRRRPPERRRQPMPSGAGGGGAGRRKKPSRGTPPAERRRGSGSARFARRWRRPVRPPCIRQALAAAPARTGRRSRATPGRPHAPPAGDNRCTGSGRGDTEAAARFSPGPRQPFPASPAEERSRQGLRAVPQRPAIRAAADTACGDQPRGRRHRAARHPSHPPHRQAVRWLGQPAARPVVPPRPDLAAKLSTPAARDARRGSHSVAAPRDSEGAQRAGAGTTDLSRSDPPRAAVGRRDRASVPVAASAARQRTAAAASHFARPHGAGAGAAAHGTAARPSGRQAPVAPAAARAGRRREDPAAHAPPGRSRAAAHQSRDHHFRRHHGQGAFREAGCEGQPGDQEADGPRHLRHHQPDARFQAGHRPGARVRRLHGHRQLRRRSHAGGGRRRRNQGPAASAPRWSPSWATWITARLRCSTPSARPTWRAGKRAASRSTSAPITWR